MKCTDKRHDFFQNQNNRKATHTFAPKPLIFKLQQEFLKFNDIYVNWSSCWSSWYMRDLVTRFEKLKNRSFEKYISEYLTLLYLMTYIFLFLAFLFFYLITYLFLFLTS